MCAVIVAMPGLQSASSFSTWEDKPLPETPNRLRQLRHDIASFASRYTAAWQKMNGYHFGVMCCAWTSAAVLVLNTSATIWGVAKFGVHGGLGTIQDGSCTTTKNVGFWLHLIINVLSTLLLGASNYSMQCLSSPTRGEVDKAHRQNLWLDIGVPSVRNLRRISASRIALWWILAASSIPLHLFYNSAIFSSLYSREYSVFVVSSDFPADASFNFSSSSWTNSIKNEFKQLQDNATTLQRLDRRACLEAYLGPINSNRGDVLLVSFYNSTTMSSPDSGGFDAFFQVAPGFHESTRSQTASQWICDVREMDSETCDLKKSASQAASWVFQQWNVQYCLSQQVEEHCKLEFSAAIMIFVICCNFVKFICMVRIARKRDSEPLVTLGDAIASFLDEPDPMTRDVCLAGQNHFQYNRCSKQSVELHGLSNVQVGMASLSKPSNSWDMEPIAWVQKRRFWFTTASASRWMVCNAL